MFKVYGKDLDILKGSSMILIKIIGNADRQVTLNKQGRTLMRICKLVGVGTPFLNVRGLIFNSISNPLAILYKE